MAAPAKGTDSKESAGDKSTPKSPKSPSNFYGYLFDEKKAPTPTLDSLLRAIGKHIVSPTAVPCPRTTKLTLGHRLQRSATRTSRTSPRQS